MIPICAKMLVDKWTGAKDTRRTVAKKGEWVTIYNTDHGDIYLCTNPRGETFSVHKDNLIIK